MTETHPIEVLLLDADGVLQYMPEGWVSRVVSDPRWPGLDALLAVEEPFLTGERRHGFPDAVAQMLREAGCTLTLDGFFEPWTEVHAQPRALELVHQVQARGVKVYLATNQQWMRALVMRDRALYDSFDGGYYSFEMGVKKPDPAYFEHIVRDLHVRRDTVLFVDDSLPNVLGARQAGIRAVHKPYEDGVAGLERVLGRHGLV